MNQAPNSPVRLNSILVSVTEVCHVGCAHCGFIGSTRDREADGDGISKWVAQVCDYGVPDIIFTGGEPFLRLGILERAVGVCRSKGVPASVFTSSYWAKDLETARRVLGRLRGLGHLYLSSDVYHQDRVPFQNVHNVIAAGRELGVPRTTIVVNYTRQEDLETLRGEYARYGNQVRLAEERIIPTPNIPGVVANQDAMRGVSPEEYEPDCWINTPIVNPNGDVFSCHVGKVGAHGDFEKSPYWLGNLGTQSFSELMSRARNNLAYQFLRTHGPRGVARMLADSPELRSSMSRDRFSGRCDMCFWTLCTSDGADALHRYVEQESVRSEINIALMALYREPPIPATGCP